MHGKQTSLHGLHIRQQLTLHTTLRPDASAAAIRDLRLRMIERTKATTIFENAATNESMPHGNHNHSHSGGFGGSTTIPIPPHKPPPRTWSAADYSLPTVPQASERESHQAPPTRGNILSWNSHPEPSAPPDYHFNALGSDSTAFNSILPGNHTFNQNVDAASFNTLDPFSGFDIPFWFEQDQHWDIFQDFI